MVIKAAIIDFDGTLTTRDMSDFLAAAVGKEKESAELNRLFLEGKSPGVSGLIQRINFLHGLTKADLIKVVSVNDYLRQGALELFEYFKRNNIVTIIASGSTIPFLEIYQEKLGADYLVGSRPQMKGEAIDLITEADYSGPDFKVRDSKAIVDSLGISLKNVLAIGDSPADKAIFEIAGASIGVNPKAGIEDYVDYIVRDDLTEVISIIKELAQKLE